MVSAGTTSIIGGRGLQGKSGADETLRRITYPMLTLDKDRHTIPIHAGDARVEFSEVGVIYQRVTSE